MKVYNTLSRQKEEFVPLEEGKVKMYVCGPTVYNFIHIGNARPMIVFDTVRRYMEYKGYEVNFVSNFTDVDDKIIKKAMEEGVTAQEISQRYIAECKKDMAAMNVRTGLRRWGGRLLSLLTAILTVVFWLSLTRTGSIWTRIWTLLLRISGCRRRLRSLMGF